jgi:hypothetical protein
MRLAGGCVIGGVVCLLAMRPLFSITLLSNEKKMNQRPTGSRVWCQISAILVQIHPTYLANLPHPRLS